MGLQYVFPHPHTLSAELPSDVSLASLLLRYCVATVVVERDRAGSFGYVRLSRLYLSRPWGERY